MDTRREFLKKTALFSGTAGMSAIMPTSIQRALSINPESGSSYLDAEHVVILMQENRSFDHCFGTLRGVRGYNDRRVIQLPDQNLAWLQSNAAGETYAPFRLNIRDTRITWMGSLPHARHDQVEAYNRGKHNKWVDAKRPGSKEYRDMPLTMGYYNREDLPFNYALADAFTVCDQHFCSVMTSTWPNRLYMWGGTIKEKNTRDSKAYVTNDIPWGEARWKTFPERLQDHNVSWKVYQNALNAGGGYKGEQKAWVGNFICNLLEWLPQYNVRFSDRYVESIKRRIDQTSAKLPKLEKQLKTLSPNSNRAKKVKQEIAIKKKVLADAQKELVKWSRENYEKLTEYQKELYRRAFVINDGDPDYLTLTTLEYEENGNKRSLVVPKGDLFYQFRKDVDSGNLPTVSWFVAPQNFSDHPSAPWYGSWYISEILDILTKNSEVWKKTIFILTYDENDGYFDHIPPFVAPDPDDYETGKCSPAANAHGAEMTPSGPIGLGYRVPFIVASPWSRGGRVCSQIFDQTSILQFLENLLEKKYGKKITEDNLTPWRRAVCGDLSSVFRSYENDWEKLPFLSRDPYIEKIYDARFKKIPNDYKKLSDAEIASVNEDPAHSELIPRQEPGKRPACAIPYQLYAEGKLSADKKSFEIRMEAARAVFGERAAGAPFYIYAPGKYRSAGNSTSYEAARNWQYATAAGEDIADSWLLNKFEDKRYHLRLYGPNGFYREFEGDANDPLLETSLEYERAHPLKNKLTGNLKVIIKNSSSNLPYKINIADNAYGNRPIHRTVMPTDEITIILDLDKSDRWYDFTIGIDDQPAFKRTYAGHVETGEDSYSDPAMA